MLKIEFPEDDIVFFNPLEEKELLNKFHFLPEDELKILINKYDDSYFNGIAEVSDETYDELVKIYEFKYGKIKETGAPVSGKAPKITLPHYMGSLDKAKEKDIFDRWFIRMKNQGFNSFVVMDKIDGVSLYNCNAKCYTRGNGKIGSDVSHISQYLKLPKNLNIEARGEVVMPLAEYEKYKDKFANPRNMVSGAIGRVHFDKIASENVDILSKCKYMAYRVYSNSGKEEHTPLEQLEILKANGYTVVNYETYTAAEISFEMLLELLIERRKDSEYEIDGLVLAANIVGEFTDDENPDHFIAVKSVTEFAITEVLAIEWTASKRGLLKPVVVFESVKLSGAMVQRASGFNAGFILDNKLGPGSKIKVTRSGEVIPYILEVISPSEDDSPSFPPGENEDWKWYSDIEIMLIELTDIVKIKRITNFFSVLGAKFLGEQTMTKLYNNGFDSVRKILILEKKDIVKIPTLGEKSSGRIIDEIQKCITGAHIWTFMDASTLFPQMGEKRIKLIFETYPSILEWNCDKIEMLQKICLIKGLKGKLASIFVDNLEIFKEFHTSISFVDIIELRPEEKKFANVIFEDEEENSIKGETIVFTGFRDKVWESKIETLGGRITTTVSSKTTMLVMKSLSGKQSSKELEARKRGVKVYSREEFSQIINKY